MAKRVRFEGNVYNAPDDASDDEVAAFVEAQVAKVGAGGGKTLAPTSPAPQASAPRQPSAMGPAPVASHPLAWLAQQGGDLSSLLGIPGGFVPGPLGAGISAFGGGAGEFMEQASRGRQIDPRAIGMEAAKQGALGLAGAGIGKAGSYVARQMMQGALRPVLKLSRVAPNVVQDALEQGATVGRVMGHGGRPAAEAVRGQAAAKTAGMLDRATQATAPLPGGAIARIRFRMSALLPNANDVVSGASPLRDVELKEARSLIGDIARNYKGAKTPVELKAIKRELQTRARSAYEAIAVGKSFRPDAED